MPSHIHMICSSSSELTISEILRDFKKFTARELVSEIKNGPESRREWLLEHFSRACAHLKRKQQFKVWQNGYHAEELGSNKFIYQKLEYVHKNPVTDGIVEKAEDYIYSSAGAYAGKIDLLNTVCIPQQVHTYF